jgi:ADP-heptose:LPS heptosyltransferase
MNIPLHLKIRRIFNSYFNSLLAKIFKNDAKIDKLDIKNIKTIALVRPNYRIGNIIFLTPLINEIGIQNPDIRIDLFVGNEAIGKILKPMPNVDTIIGISRKLLTNPFKLYSFIKKYKTKRYDLCINISSSSLSSQIVTMFINAKYKLSFEDEKSWVTLTHKVKHKGLFSHISLQPLELLGGFNIYEYNHKKELDIKLTQNELNKAKNDLTKLLEKNDLRKDSKIISIFRNARFDKKIEDTWWNNFINELKNINKNIVIIDILSPDIPNKLNDNVIEYSNKDLRQLGAFFSACDAYISADTGPLHLAAASYATSIGLFNHTIIEVYGTLGEQNLNIDLNNLDEKHVAKQIASKLKLSEY